jgi:hypothetical protein
MTNPKPIYPETKEEKEAYLDQNSFDFIDEKEELQKEDKFRKQLDSQNPLFEKRKYVATNASFRNDRKGVQPRLDMNDNLVNI